MEIPVVEVFNSGEYKEWILQRIGVALSSRWFTLGNFNNELALMFAEYHRAKFHSALKIGPLLMNTLQNYFWKNSLDSRIKLKCGEA